MVFHLLDDAEIQRLAVNQTKIKSLTTKLKRGKVFAEFSQYNTTGGMHPVGFRQPSGGRPGDGYGPYPGSFILGRADIHTLFGYAMVGHSSIFLKS